MESTPLNSPTKYLRYGSGAYKVLCYARFRKDQAFTSVDYRNFVLGNVSRKRLDANLLFLTKIGYLEKFAHPNPQITNTYGFAKYLYKITLDGSHALMVLGRSQRMREEKIRRQSAYNNGLSRWKGEQKVLGFQIQTK